MKEEGKDVKRREKTAGNGRNTAKNTKKRKKIEKLKKTSFKRLTTPCLFGKINRLRKYAVYWADAGSYCKSEEKATSADNFRRQCEGSTLATDRGFA